MRTFCALAVVSLVVLVGCDKDGGGDQPGHSSARMRFPHKVHIEDEEMTCAMCHGSVDKPGGIGLPADLNGCKKCHDGLDAKKPADKQISQYLVNGVPQWTHISKQSSEIKFNHESHIQKAKLDCNACHGDVAKSNDLGSVHKMKMSDCMSCHAKLNKTAAAQSNRCELCHTQLRADLKPADHERNWKQRHGKAIGFLSKEDQGRCEVCHTQDWCIKCHRDEAPRNHTNYWRERGHSVIAEMDRRACKTCHTEDFCQRCHREAAPRVPAAVGGFHRSVRSNERCKTCHMDASQNRRHEFPASHREPGFTHCLKCHRSDFGPGR